MWTLRDHRERQAVHRRPPRIGVPRSKTTFAEVAVAGVVSEVLEPREIGQHMVGTELLGIDGRGILVQRFEEASQRLSIRPQGLWRLPLHPAAQQVGLDERGKAGGGGAG